jgi:hypothetical protein
MTPADRYRVKAAELMARARLDTNPMLRLECENLALAYLRLADQADRNAQTQNAQTQNAQTQAASGSFSGQQTAGPGQQQQQQQQQSHSEPKQEPEKD